MPEAFKIGDVVQLKSGGPIMTVSHLHDAGALECMWFDGNQRRTATFKPDTLDTVD